MTKDEREALRRLAEAARDEKDTTQPRDWDAVSPHVEKVNTMHAELSPERVVELLMRIAMLEARVLDLRAGVEDTARMPASLAEARAADDAAETLKDHDLNFGPMDFS